MLHQTSKNTRNSSQDVGTSMANKRANNCRSHLLNASDANPERRHRRIFFGGLFFAGIDNDFKRSMRTTQPIDTVVYSLECLSDRCPTEPCPVCDTSKFGHHTQV